MSGDPLAHPIACYADVERLLLSRVREDPRAYAARGANAKGAVRALLARAGDPHHGACFLHIAGSKGKGSVALLAEALLRAAGHIVGTYTSPHLLRWNERIRVRARPISDAAMCEAMEFLRPHVAALDALGDDALSPSFFDLLTAAALLVFARARCRVVVLEAGLGGLYDATSIVSPAACCISSIELEHTDKLGSTIEDIARHKAGIIKPGVVVVTGELPARAQAVVAAAAEAAAAREWRVGRDWSLDSVPESERLQRVVYREHCALGGQRRVFRLHHHAPHMALNAGLAIALVRAAGFQARAGVLIDCTLPGRAQLLRERPWVVVDGAHTPASLQALALTLDALPAARRRFVVSTTRGKSDATLSALAGVLEGCEALIVTRADATRSMPAHELAHELAQRLPGVAIEVIADPYAALRALSGDGADDALLCACGSIYLAGIALSVLGDAIDRCD